MLEFLEFSLWLVGTLAVGVVLGPIIFGLLWLAVDRLFFNKNREKW